MQGPFVGFVLVCAHGGGAFEIYIGPLFWTYIGSLVCRLANYYFLETNQAVIGNGYNK